MKYSLTFLALVVATFTSALPYPEVVNKRGGPPGDSWGGHGGGHGGDHGGDHGPGGPGAWGPSQPKQQQEQQQQQKQQQQQQQDDSGCDSAQCLDDIQDHTYVGLPNSASPPPDDTTWATTKEKRGPHEGPAHGGPKDQNSGNDDQQYQRQEQDGDCDTAQCLDDIQDHTYVGLPNSASPPPDDTTWATTKEKRGSPAPGESTGEGSGEKDNGKAMGQDSGFWGP